MEELLTCMTKGWTGERAVLYRICTWLLFWVIGVNFGRSRFNCYRYRKTLVLCAGLHQRHHLIEYDCDSLIPWMRTLRLREDTFTQRLASFSPGFSLDPWLLLLFLH